MKPGITFKGVSSRDLGLTMKSGARLVLPGVSRSYVDVVGYPGAVDFGQDTYTEGQMQLSFSWISVTMEDSSRVVDSIVGWLHNDGKYYDLVFSDSPQKKYRAKVTEAVQLQVESHIGRVDVTFTVNPPYAFTLDGAPMSPAKLQEMLLWDTANLEGHQYRQDFPASGFMRFTNRGVAPVRPVIRLNNIVPSGITLTYGSQSWQYTGPAVLYDSILIDCQNETVTRGSDGANLFPNVNPAKDDFFQLQPGKLQINVTAAGLGGWPKNLVILVTFEPMGGV